MEQQDQIQLTHQILGQMLEGCQIIDRNWVYRYLNDTVLEHARLNREKLIGKKMTEVYPGIEKTELFAQLSECMQNHSPKKFNNKFDFGDGTFAWFELNVRPIEEGLLILSWDITEQLKSEEELRQTAETLRTVIDTSPIAKVITNPDGIVSLWNQAAEEIFGWPAGEVLGKPSPLTSPVDGGKIPQNRRRVFTGEILRNQTMEIYRKDGQRIQILFSASPLYDQSGAIRGALSASMDVTEQKRAEQQVLKLNAELEKRVEERTAELSDLYNNAPCGYHSLDKDGTILMVNDTELKWLGYEREEIVGKVKIFELFTPASVKVFQENYPNFIKNGYVNNLEFEMIRKDGSLLPILLSGTAIYDEQGQYKMSRSTMINHTARKEAERAMEQAKAQLEAANKELEAFAYSVSHDLRAPLRHISGYVELLKSYVADSLDEKSNHYLSVVSESAKRMGDLIDDLLTFSRIGRADVNMEKVNMQLLVQETRQELDTEMEGRDIEWQVDPLPIVYGDRSLLRLVWINLISNAIKYTQTRPQARIQIEYWTDGNELVFKVSDNGVGFNMKYVGKLFGVFQRLHRVEDFEGTGIGLANVQRIILRHGGRVWAEGKEEEGAAFYFTLPNNI